MSGTEFNNEIQNAATLADPQAAKAKCLQALAKKTASECLYPHKMKLQISDLGTTHEMYVRCGKCNYCRSYLQGEWFTRMWHETEVSAHVYMVTLTYKGYANPDDIPAQLQDAYWHYDNVNYNHVYQYRPCLCRIEHLQMFHRNLRRIIPFKYKYFAAMEYGSEYGSPHFHLIIWTKEKDDVLTSDIIRLAWSVNLGTRKNPKWDNIGKVDFEDCNLNGTIQKDITIDHRQYDAKNAFQYLAKYVNKFEVANYQRVDMFRHDLLDGLTISTDSDYKAVFAHLDKWINKTYLDDAKMFTDSGISPEKLLYDKVLDLAESSLLSFSKLFRSRTTCSRSEGIGALYAKLNLERMAAGNQNIVDKKYGRLICPRYYIRKVREFLNPIQCRSKLAGCQSFSAQNRPYICANLNELLDLPFSNPMDKNVVRYCDLDSISDLQLSELLHSPYAFKNAYSGERIVIISSSEIDRFSNPHAAGFMFDRHKRSYVLSSFVPLREFVEYYTECCKKSYDYSFELIERAERDYAQLESAKEIFDAIFFSTDWRYENVSPYNDYRTTNVEYLRQKYEEQRREKYEKFSKKLF